MLHAVRLTTFFVIVLGKRNQTDHTPKGTQGSKGFIRGGGTRREGVTGDEEKGLLEMKGRPPPT